MSSRRKTKKQAKRELAIQHSKSQDQQHQSRRASSDSAVESSVGYVTAEAGSQIVRRADMPGKQPAGQLVHQEASTAPLTPVDGGWKSYVKTTFSTYFIGTLGLLGTIAGLYSVRPVITVNSPDSGLRIRPDPLYVNFVINNQGHMPASNVKVFCWPAKAVYGNGDTLSAQSDQLAPTYENVSVESFRSFTARYAPLFDLFTLDDRHHDRVIVLGRQEQCIHHYKQGASHYTKASECPIELKGTSNPRTFAWSVPARWASSCTMDQPRPHSL